MNSQSGDCRWLLVTREGGVITNVNLITCGSAVDALIFANRLLHKAP